MKERAILVLLLTLILSVVLIVRIQLSWTTGGSSSTPFSRDPVHSQAADAQGPSSNQVSIRTHTLNPEPPLKDQSSRAGRLNMSSLVSSKDPWSIWMGWVKPDYLYPENAFYSEEMNHILAVMATAPITSFGVGHKGTQLKATAMLGMQRTVFKPKR